MSEVTQDLLDDIFASVDAREALPDTAANSCDEEGSDESDLDVPKALPPQQLLQQQASSSRGTPKASSSTSALPRAGPTPMLSRQPLRPAGVNSPAIRSSGITASAGRGGRMVYQAAPPAGGGNVYYFMVQWRKPQQKKHKTWDGDAYLKITGSRMTLTAEDGKNLATGLLAGGLPGAGSELRIGGFECEVDRAMTADEYRRGSSCLAATPVQQQVDSPARTPTSSGYKVPFKVPTLTNKRLGASATGRGFSSPLAARPQQQEQLIAGPPTPTPAAAVAAGSFYGAAPAKKIVIGERSSKQREMWGGALHDPNAEGAVVMERPPTAEGTKRNTRINDVVVDPTLSAKMREHQRQGVQFMYRCVMGMAGTNAQGCILADEMGLGKTLQTIALIHTLCKQSPFENQKSVISRALVVCPVTLVNNWKYEFKKWLGRDFNVQAVEDADDSKIRAFTHNKSQNVLIIGYERLRKYIKTLAACQPPIGLIVCDEGHRLKSKDTKTAKMFDALSTSRRIILSGTPVQNDLGEYWAMANFACPGVFGTYQAFVRQYEKPILKARLPDCSKADSAAGQERHEELSALTTEFVLRRTAAVLDAYLPPKNEYVVFVAPTALQLEMFGSILGGGRGDALVKGRSSAQLATIDLLRKVANSPTLVKPTDEDSVLDDSVTAVAQAASALIGIQNSHDFDVTVSGKLIVLDEILKSIKGSRTKEKVVVVSNWTSTLDMIEGLVKKRRYGFLRLDGKTPQKQRQSLVNDFNKGPRSESMVFLLSAKAGGVGLNLIGASRLVLFDSDWNPSTDLQAMARIHRDGQKNEVYIYRLLTTNTIDEKIYQRQLTKTGLADQMMGEGGDVGTGTTAKDSFSYQELRDIFTVNVHTDGCQTHDLLGCDCGGHNTVVRDSSAETETREGTPAAAGQSKGRGGSSDDSDGDSSDEELGGFTAASQYDPGPTRKQQRKATQVQQAKLAALKRWRHLDAFESKSFKTVHDNLLYNLMREAFNLHQDIVEDTGAPSDPLPLPDAPPPAKKQRRSVFDVIDDAYDEITAEVEAEAAADANVVADSEDEGGASDVTINTIDSDSDDDGDDDDEPVRVGQRRKRSSRESANTSTRSTRSSSSRSKAKVESGGGGGKKGKGKGKTAASPVSLAGASSRKRHNLSTTADAGQAGRIMFVFEKQSKARMDADTDAA